MRLIIRASDLRPGDELIDSAGATVRLVGPGPYADWVRVSMVTTIGAWRTIVLSEQTEVRIWREDE